MISVSIPPDAITFITNSLKSRLTTPRKRFSLYFIFLADPQKVDTSHNERSRQSFESTNPFALVPHSWRNIIKHKLDGLETNKSVIYYVSFGNRLANKCQHKKTHKDKRIAILDGFCFKKKINRGKMIIFFSVSNYPNLGFAKREGNSCFLT